MPVPPVQADSADRARQARPFAALPCFGLDRIGVPAATAVLVATAVVSAVLLHVAIAAARGVPYGLAFAAETAAVTILVATPLVIYSLIAIRRHAEARRVLRQVTERLSLSVHAAEEANRAQTQFLANMSHELRTPLNAIIGFADLMQAEKLGPIGHRRYLEYLGDIEQSGHHLLRIINDILDLSKIEAGGADMRDEEELNLAAVIDATLRMMRPLAERQGVALEGAGDVRGVRLLAVERMICQVMLNLLSNAVKFTAAGGRVTLAATGSANGGLVVAVADTGLGMSAEEIKIALTPFGQVDNAMSRRHSGTGLGLPLAKAMMELHGGSLLIASSPGKGTTASLAFPPARVIRAVAEQPLIESADPARGAGVSRAA